MKCEHCGHTIHAFKEIKQAMANEGFDREYLMAEIKTTIDAAVRSAVSKAIEPTIAAEMKQRINGYLYDKTISDAIKLAIGEAMREQFVVSLRKGGE